MYVTIMIRRAAAVGAAASGLLHLLMLGHQGHHLGWSLAMAGMGIICLPCAGHLWRTASRRSWITIAAMNAAMLGVHLWMLTLNRPNDTLRADQLGGTAPAAPTLPDPQSGPTSHVHGLATDAGSVGSAAGTQAGELHELLLPLASGLAGIEILLALVGLSLLRRPPPPSVHAEKRPLHAESTVPRPGGHILIEAPSRTDEGVAR